MPAVTNPCKVFSKIACATGSIVNACTLFSGIAPNISLGVGFGEEVSVGSGVSVGATVAVADG
jgi:hypothetical protein